MSVTSHYTKKHIRQVHRRHIANCLQRTDRID